MRAAEGPWRVGGADNRKHAARARRCGRAAAVAVKGRNRVGGLAAYRGLTVRWDAAVSLSISHPNDRLRRPRMFATLLDQTLAVAQRIWLEQWRQGRGLIFWALFPALMMLLFGLVYAHNDSMCAGLDAMAAGVLMGAALFFSCLGGTVAILVAERERRTLRRLLASPLQPLAYFLGVVLAQSALALMQVVMLYAIAYAIGARYHGSIALGAVIITLSVFAYVGLGFFFGARFARRSEEVVVALSAFGVPLLVLGGTFFPLVLMPEAMQTVAHLNPILYMNEALKAVAAQGAGLADLRSELAFLVVFCGLALGLGVSSYRHLLRLEKSA